MKSDVAKALLTIQDDADLKVLRRFKPRHAYGIVHEPKVALFVDVETTGLNTDEDKIIQFAAARFEFDADGNIGHVGPTYSGLEDPGVPLSLEIIELTGITDERLKGQRIDDGKVAELLSGVVLVIAHNAQFDRKMVERRFATFDTIAWACSQRDVKWEKFGSRGAKLDYLLMVLCGEFYDAHDAMADCLAGIELLATPQHKGRSAFAMLLESAREPTLRLFAHNSAFSTKQRLSLRGYRWHPDPIKAWAKDIKPADLDAEKQWLLENIYGHDERCAKAATFVKISAYDRYSVRA